MNKQNEFVVVSWVGDSDIIAWAATHLPWQDEATGKPSETQNAVLQGLKGHAFRPSTPLSEEQRVERLQKAKNNHWGSSIAAIAEQCRIGHPRSKLIIVLLSNIGEKAVSLFQKWLQNQFQATVIYRPFSFTGTNIAMDYEECYKWVKNQIQALNLKGMGGYKLYFNLTSGSSAMTTSLVIFGKTQYPDASSFVIHQDCAIKECHIPFDLALIYKLRDDTIKRSIPESLEIKGSSNLMQKARELAAAIALFPQTVLLLGPNGSGKELFARYIHFKSKRKGHLKTINCSLFTPERFQSELFGHVKGAFTGAMKDRPGLAMQADGGTLFLDEIGDCGLEVQAQLLRFLQEDPDDVLSREIIPLGADDPLPQKPKVRIIAATNKPLVQMVAQGAFREDLYYRLAAFEIQIPSLSQRKNDISELVEFFRAKTPYPQGLKKPAFSVGAIAALREYTWPGNVRQLKSCIGRLFLSAYMKSAEIIREEDVFEVMGHPCANVEPHEEDDKTLDALLERIQRFWIEKALAETNGNKEAAAKLLGLKSGQTLANRLSKVPKKF